MLDTIVEGLEAAQEEVRIHVSEQYTSAFSVGVDMREDPYLTSEPATELQTRAKAESGEKVSLVVHLKTKAFEPQPWRNAIVQKCKHKSHLTTLDTK